MILHFSQMRFTDGRTFMALASSPLAVRDAPARQVIGRQFHRHPVAGQDADEVHAHLARNMAEHLVAVVQLHPEHGVGQRLDDSALHLDHIVFAHGLSPPPSPSRRAPPGPPALPRLRPSPPGPTAPPARQRRWGGPPSAGGFSAWGGPQAACRRPPPGQTRPPSPDTPHTAGRDPCPPGIPPPCPVPTAC